jgi:hypothetical protein
VQPPDGAADRSRSDSGRDETHLTIIGVGDVPSSFKWYQSLFGQPKTAPGHDDFSQLLIRMEPSCSASTSGARTGILLAEPRRGVTWQWALLFFRVDDYVRH